ncbi:hypothetical protein ScPMuIL_001317 [Solemya velum]
MLLYNILPLGLFPSALLPLVHGKHEEFSNRYHLPKLIVRISFLIQASLRFQRQTDMLSRAHLLIERECEKFYLDPPWGIQAEPLTDGNIFEWVAKIKGLKETLWEGGIFRIYLKFDENFNIRPPEACFHTIPFHPNVDMVTGKPCVDFLDDYSQWNESYSLSMLLLAIQNLLANPVLSNPVNPEAAEMMLNSPLGYRQMVLDCVAASQRLEAGVSPHLDLDSRVHFATTENVNVTARKTVDKPVGSKVAKLSFEDYHMTWCGIATSKYRLEAKNSLHEMIKDNARLQQTHLGLPVEEIEEQMKRQIEDHAALMYGRFRNKPSPDEDRAMKLAKLNKMKKIYLPPRISPTPFSVEAGPPPPSKREGKDEPWEKEVDDLVAWTNNLDANAFDI